MKTSKLSEHNFKKRREIKMKTWRFWELTVIGFAIVTIILAIVAYFVEAFEPYSMLATCILIAMNFMILVMKFKKLKEKNEAGNC